MSFPDWPIRLMNWANLPGGFACLDFLRFVIHSPKPFFFSLKKPVTLFLNFPGACRMGSMSFLLTFWPKLVMALAGPVCITHFAASPAFPLTHLPGPVRARRFPTPGAAERAAETVASKATFFQLTSEASRLSCKAFSVC